ncbi:MAG: 50S ribosomal protein L9 [Pseudomonadota bacterium]|nr:50S ribosomal protein L9 [Pseudomonadota bacterium]HJO36711.1 50S ribosomal protein L9 [Gammaproteobacteria bacterium]
MEVILLERLENLGDLGERVNVKSGYARNFLIPKRKAVPATAERIAEFETRRADLEAAAAQLREQAQARADQLEGLRLTLSARSAGENRLYGSISTVEIAEAAQAEGAQIERKEIRLPEGAIREAGEHEVEIYLHPDVSATILVEVLVQE